MVPVIRQRVTVQPGGIIEIRSPDLVAGTEAEVIVLIEPAVGGNRSLTRFRGAAKGLFTGPEEVDTFIRNERDAWDR